jgi:hypothetical protein
MKFNPLYSVNTPATNSDSASVKSKGGLAVSARADKKNNKEIGNKGNKKGISICKERI